VGISNGTGGGNVVEGPMWARFNGRGEWALWLDQFATGRGYMPITSTNLGSTQNFQTRSDYGMGANRKRHGSILNLTAAEESRVLGRWGATVPINRIQSFDHQDRYVRHANFDVRIDANVSPAQDAQFRLVPGLANGSGHVSFASVNFPGYHLRHYGFDFVQAPDDGTAAFAADATFRQVAGARRRVVVVVVVVPVLQPSRPVPPALRLPAPAGPDHRSAGAWRRHLPRDVVTS
jgi:hypothetical protein